MKTLFLISFFVTVIGLTLIITYTNNVPLYLSWFVVGGLLTAYIAKKGNIKIER